MPSTAKQAETNAFESVRATPFTRVHGRPTRRDYKIPKEEACALASEVDDITYAWSKNGTDNYGLLTDIIGVDEYDDLTNISKYAIPHELASSDPNITDTTLTYTRKQMEEEWELVRTSWFIQKGFLHGVVDNLRDALDEQYYSQLRHRLTAYRSITPYQILEHLNNRWCPLDMKAKKELKKAYYTKWDHAVERLPAFGKRLNDDQRSLVRSDVTIAYDNKLQFYLEEIYDSNCFDKQEMLTWEWEPSATKTDFDLAKHISKLSSMQPTPTNRMQVGEQQDASSTNQPIKWQTTAMRSESTSNNSPAQAQPTTQPTQWPTSRQQTN